VQIVAKIIQQVTGDAKLQKNYKKEEMKPAENNNLEHLQPTKSNLEYHIHK
jgi:hypothetical protein